MLAARGAGELQTLLREREPDAATLLALLRRPVPVALLELVATRPPFCEERRVLGAVAANPRTPPRLSLRLLPDLYWRDQAEVARNLALPPAVRSRADSLLQDGLAELRLGDRLTLARLATPILLRALLRDADPRVIDAGLECPRLSESELTQAIARKDAPARLMERVAASTRWGESYAVRLALVAQPRTPLGVALAQLTGLDRRDLLRIGDSPGLLPLLQAAALRVVTERTKALN
ncbi:MAG: hypothetical protein AB7O37_21185 [Vicinamibacteria bacterium]